MPLARRGRVLCELVAAQLLWALLAGAVAAEAPAQPVASAVSVCAAIITGSSGTTVDVSYAGLPGNQPKLYGDFVALWENSVVPWTIAAAARLGIPTDAEIGTLVLTGVSVSTTPYTVGYAVGPKVDDVCASALLAADGSTGVVDAVTLQLASIGTTSLTFRYHTLSGYLPATAGNWVGLWRGRASPYNAPAPVARVNVVHDVTDDNAVIQGVTLSPGEIYTAIYFMGESLTTAAALLNFVAPVR
ncbi:hypothetical protein QYH69_31445 [Paraburkholderia sp. SARCC-3016]|uniref:hypothetical protein n=1 Tax=Paraburkholderia sp. SARCC-3016 TaxID=3058611 RepID=UPI002808B04B|nr:hypothetical protein [Paraburkholderia sp. SARCC-3016]MDQ7981741.1 hypothetical protein [Paraburkholderia sp. SARCC-3016]